MTRPLSRLAERLRAVVKKPAKPSHSAPVMSKNPPIVDDRPLTSKPVDYHEALPVNIKAANEVINAQPLSKAQELPGFDRAAFFTELRKGELRHRKPTQVQGSEAILTAMEGLPLSWVAYALATAWHETGYTMKPVKEMGGRAYFMRMYDKTGQRPKVARALGNTEVGDGALFAGRGYVQLTGRRNYAKAGEKVGVDLIANPDLAMDYAIAARILREGMVEGWFTAKKFVTYLPATDTATLAQFTQARRIINGMDRAGKIALEAIGFQAALVAGGWE
jgi:putative chitinase